MEAGKDPRTDQTRSGKDAHADPPSNSESKPAPGGVGTGTKEAPEHAPASTPKP